MYVKRVMCTYKRVTYDKINKKVKIVHNRKYHKYENISKLKISINRSALF